MRSVVLLILAGCGTLNGARPLHPGQHEVGLTLGGPLLQFGAPIPLPNAVVGARSGLTHIANRPMDLGYGINATALPFGIIALHGDLGWLAIDQHGSAPALTVRNKLFLTSNFAATGKPTGVDRGLWVADEIDLIASWKINATVVYASIGQAFDLSHPELNLVPALGASIDFGKPGGFTLQPEIRWWAVNRAFTERNIRWVPGSPGAIGVHLGFATRFGKNP